jgi:hypothetical protein
MGKLTSHSVGFVGGMAMVLAISTTSFDVNAATITVNQNGPPMSGRCNLTDAIRAASTNASVRGCPAGQWSTDTVVLQANTTYEAYGAPLHVPAGGGPVIISGTLVSGETTTAILGRNYGFPSPNPINSTVCQYPAAIFVGGGNVTIRNLNLWPDNLIEGKAGICQYSGGLTIDNVGIYDFDRGGVWSYPNTPSNHRTLTMQTIDFWSNYSPVVGAAVSLHGSMTVSITNAWIQENSSNESGGALHWNGHGSLTVTDVDFNYNHSLYAFGGGVNLNPDEPGSIATFSNVAFYGNSASHYGGAMWVGDNLATNGLRLQNTYISPANYGTDAPGVPDDPAHNSFNADTWVYDRIYCTAGSIIGSLNHYPWTWNTPRLKGDGTCTFP